MPVQDLGSPSDQPLVTPGSVAPPFPGTDGPDDKVKMKKQLGLLEGVAIILGIIFGSGKYSNLQTKLLRLQLKSVCYRRHFRFAQGCHSGGECRRYFAYRVGSLRTIVNDRSSVLCRAWNFNSRIWR